MLYHNGENLQKRNFRIRAASTGSTVLAWNCRMTKAEIDNTLDALKAMGMGGGHIHWSYRNGQSVLG